MNIYLYKILGLDLGQLQNEAICELYSYVYIWIQGNRNTYLSHLEKIHGKQQSCSLFHLYRNIESETISMNILLLREW